MSAGQESRPPDLNASAPPGGTSEASKKSGWKITGHEWLVLILGLLFGIAATLASDPILHSRPWEKTLKSVGIGKSEAKRVAIVLPFKSGDAKAAEEIYAGVKQAHLDFCELRTTSIACKNKPVSIKDKDDFFQPVDDFGVPSEARRVAGDIVKDDSYVGVIGHLSSSTTEEALKEYCTHPTLPVIMPTVTATNIMNVAKSDGCRAVLRLPPTNEVQGSKAAELLALLWRKENGSKEEDPTIGIMRDQINPLYSNDYGRAFLDAMRKQLDLPEGAHYSILFNVAVGAENSGLPVTSGMVQLKDVNVLLIIGMTDLVLQSLRQAKMKNWEPKSIVLTDGAVSDDLTKEGYGLLKSNVYVVFPLPKETPKELQALHKRLGLKSNALSFAGYGYDSAMLMLLAIDTISGDVTRDALSSAISNWMKNRTQIDPRQLVAVPGQPAHGSLSFVLSSTYTFDKEGNNTRPTVGLYEYNPSADGDFTTRILN